MVVLGIIPARYGSTRFPGKALALLGGKPMVQHVYERARQAKRLDDVVVATDDERIVVAVSRFGGRAVMTSAEHRSGTDRIAEVTRSTDASIIVNIQGDEPLMRPEPIDQIVEFLQAHRAVPMATVMTRVANAHDAASPNVVKVVVDQDGYAMYFSRSSIPYPRQQGARVAYWKHLGLYGYQRDFLLRFPNLPPTPCEQAESLEQLRALEHGHRIKVLETTHDSIGVDTPDDLKRVEQMLMAQSQ